MVVDPIYVLWDFQLIHLVMKFWIVLVAWLLRI